MLQRKEKIAVIAGSHTDLKAILGGLRWLREQDTPCRVWIASLHNLTELQEWLAQAVNEGIAIFIVAQGGSALLPGIVAAQTLQPVIGVPLDTSRHRGTDAWHSMAALPDGQDLLLTRINGIFHALRAAIRMLALADPNYQQLNEELRQQELEESGSERESLQEKYREVFAAPARPEFAGVITSLEELAERAEDAPEGTAVPDDAERDQPAAKAQSARGGSSPVCSIDPLNPDIALIERAAGQLLNGEVVALPTDTVYGLAADATNPAALDKLLALKGRGANHPLPVMICNEEQLRQLVRNAPVEVKRELDQVWPGPLTLVFEKYPGTFRKISSDDSIGVRIPDHFVMLSVLNAVNRPLAVTSANPTGSPPAANAREIGEYFGGGVALILDGGPSASSAVSTVLDVRRQPYRIVREGLFTRAKLGEIFGAAIE